MQENNEIKTFWALQSVVFKKPYSIEEAKEEVQNFIKNEKLTYIETAKMFKFRNIPRTKFKGKLKKINLKNGISLYIGELKKEYQHLEGGGIFDLLKKPLNKVKEFFKPREGFNNTTTKTLKQYGNYTVKKLTIARTPILSILDKAINLLSFGKWEQLKKEYSFDKLFHLQLIATVENKNIVIEKNEVINIDTTFKINKDTEILEVPLNNNVFTINEMMTKTKERMGPKFYSYDGFYNNCQIFIKECLLSVNLYSEKENTFLFQDLSELAKKMPSLTKKIMNITTKTGAIVNKLRGKGNKKNDLKKEFLKDSLDHDKKLKKLESIETNKKILKETLEGLKELTQNGLNHIELIEKILNK